MSLHERQPKTNIIRKVAKIGVPVTLLVSQAACATTYDINIPPCDTDPQPKTKTISIARRADGTRDELYIDKITLRATDKGG